MWHKILCTMQLPGSGAGEQSFKRGWGTGQRRERSKILRSNLSFTVLKHSFDFGKSQKINSLHSNSWRALMGGMWRWGFGMVYRLEINENAWMYTYTVTYIKFYINWFRKGAQQGFLIKQLCLNLYSYLLPRSLPKASCQMQSSTYSLKRK